jgi:tetratricopeptide (TPR) repeat protein
MRDAHTSLPQTPDHLERAERLKLEGKHQEALHILENILLEEPENIAALEEVADNELSLGHSNRAETAALQVLSLDKESFTAHYILGFLHSQKNKWNDAMDHLKEANKIYPNNPEILRCLGWALFCNNHRPQGIVTLERALNLEHDNTFILCDLGVAYLQVKKFSKARSLFLHALSLDPNNIRVKECFDAVCLFEKEFKKLHNKKTSRPQKR